MLNQRLIQHIKNQRWENGSTWEFDWYIDVMFCHAMAYGTNPIKINYIQPILDDEFLNTSQHQHRLEGFENFLNEKSKVIELINNQDLIIKKANELLDSLRSDYSKLDYDNYYKTQYDLSLLMASVSTIFDKLIEEHIDAISASKSVPIETISNYIIESSSVTALNKSNEELLALYNKNKKEFEEHFKQDNPLSTDITKILEKHVEKFGWLNTGEKGKKPWVIGDFLIQLNNLVNSAKAKTSVVDGELKEELADIIKINVNDNIAADIQIELDFMFQKHLAHILQEKYDENIISILTFEEIKMVIENPAVLTKYSEKKSITHRLAYPTDNKVVVEELSNQEYQELKELLTTNIQTHLKITGRSACQGMAEGIVKIIRKMSDLDNFEAGQILVAEKTQPSYVMAMQKAKALVTDIGGITSHAAIISREFNIPCIVATKTATKQLHDGDFVRVDAFSGEVIKLN